jgi:hypothetical protein
MALGEESIIPLGGILAVIAGIIMFFVVLMIAIYIFISLAFMAIGKRAKLKTPELAWIPGVGPLIIAFQTSKMHWWPWLLLIGVFIPFLNFIAMIVFAVFAVIWQWKMFETIKRPGWWSLLCLITPVNIVLYSIAAWGKK